MVANFHFLATKQAALYKHWRNHQFHDTNKMYGGDFNIQCHMYCIYIVVRMTFALWDRSVDLVSGGGEVYPHGTVPTAVQLKHCREITNTYTVTVYIHTVHIHTVQRDMKKYTRMRKCSR